MFFAPDITTKGFPWGQNDLRITQIVSVDASGAVKGYRETENYTDSYCCA